MASINPDDGNRNWLQFIIASREDVPWLWLQVIVPLAPVVGGALILVVRGTSPPDLISFINQGNLLFFAALLSLGIYLELEFASKLAIRLQAEAGLAKQKGTALGIGILLVLCYGANVWAIGLPSPTQPTFIEQCAWAIAGVISSIAVIISSIAASNDCTKSFRRLQQEAL